MKTKVQISCAVTAQLIRHLDSTISLLPKSEISSFQPSSETVQASLCRTRSETQRQVFSCRGSLNAVVISMSVSLETA